MLTCESGYGDSNPFRQAQLTKGLAAADVILALAPRSVESNKDLTDELKGQGLWSRIVPGHVNLLVVVSSEKDAYWPPLSANVKPKEGGTRPIVASLDSHPHQLT